LFIYRFLPALLIKIYVVIWEIPNCIRDSKLRMNVLKKLVILHSFILVLFLVSKMSAAAYWTDADNDSLWMNPDNWLDYVLPTSNDTVYIRHGYLVVGGQGPIITDGMNIGIKMLVLEAENEYVSLEMTGGTLFCNQDIGGDGIQLGAGSGAGLAELNMSGGKITTYDRIRIGLGYEGRMYMSGDATVYTSALEMDSSHSLLDIGGDAEFHIIRDATSDLNPVMPGADPDILLVDDTVWIYMTYGYYKRFYAYSSTDLVNWKVHGPILDFDDIPWIVGKCAWAPGIEEKDGMYYLYYSAGPKPSYIGVAYSSSPAGPFQDSGQALLYDNGDLGFEAIDAMVFTDPCSCKSYLYAGGSAGSRLRVFELNNNMISLAREITVDNPINFTEGSFMHYRDGIYYLSYSHGSWNSDSYSVHYSTSDTPYGPHWDYKGAILVSDDRHKGPGHHSFLYNTAIDEWYIFYHRWNDRDGSGPYTGWRDVAIEKLQYEEDGTIKPIIMTDEGVGPVWLGTSLLADYTRNGVVDYQDLMCLTDAWLTYDAAVDIAPVGGDRITNFLDLAVFAQSWLKGVITAIPSDFISDGRVDFRDFSKLAHLWMQYDPSIDIAPPPNGDGIIDEKELALFALDWLNSVD
jgi:hypothetical protein